MAKLKFNEKRSQKKVVFFVLCLALLVVLIGVVATLLIFNNAQSKEISHILVISMPNKVEYYLDESFEIDGLKVQVVLNNGDSYIAEHEELAVEGFDSSEIKDNLTLAVRYQGFSDTFVVSIKPFPKPKPTLVSIEVKNYISTYTWEEWQSNWINLNGAYIECYYNDDSTYRVTLTTSRIIDGLSDINGPGTYELTVYYDEYESGIFCTTTFTITITE